MDATGQKKFTLRAIGLAGLAIFGTVFALTFSVPGWVENFAADYIESKAQERVDATIDALEPPESDNALVSLARTLYEQNEEQISYAKGLLKAKVHEQWASAIADVRGLDCECRKKWAAFLESGIYNNLEFLRATNTRIAEFIHSSYMDVATNLKRDIRIFSATNAAAFLLLLMLSFTKPNAAAHLFLPGILLAISTLACSYGYIFEQNWLLTIINNDYLGLAYLGWLSVVFLFLCDIALNSGHITTAIVNAILEAIGQAATLVPC